MFSIENILGNMTYSSLFGCNVENKPKMISSVCPCNENHYVKIHNKMLRDHDAALNTH